MLLGTGVALLAVRPSDTGLLLQGHKASFVIWFAVMTIHVLGHLKDASLTAWHELRSVAHGFATQGRGLRFALIALALVFGAVAAGALLPTASPWTTGRLAAPTVEPRSGQISTPAETELRTA